MSNIEKFDHLKAEIKLRFGSMLDMVVVDKETMDAALLSGKEAKHYAKLVEEKRKELVKPLNDQVNAINEYAKQISEPLKTAEMHIKSQLVAHEQKLEAIRREEQKRLEEERRRKEEELAKKQQFDREQAEIARAFAPSDEDDKNLKRQELVAEAAANREQHQLQRQIRSDEKAIEANRVSGTRKVWKFAIEEAGLVPREFLVVDEQAVRRAVAAGVREIPGVRIFEETSIALR